MVIFSVAFNVLPDVGFMFSAIIGIFGTSYVVWAAVSVWQCAFNTVTKAWGYMGRGVILLHVLIIVISMAAALWRA